MAKKQEGNQESLGLKLKHYKKLTSLALEKASILSGLGEEKKEMAEKLLEMSRNYCKDAQYFESREMPLTALAAYSYAHAWLDAGVRLRLLDGKDDDKLFTLP